MRKIWFRKCDSFEEEEQADREYWAEFTPDERVALIEDLKRTWTMISSAARPPNDDQSEFVACLNRHRARALIVGAYAIAFHAKPRFTDALDVLVERSHQVAAAIKEFAGELASSELVLKLGTPPNRIDIYISIAGVSFDEAWNSRVEGAFGNQRASFIGKAELMRNKQAVARPQDLADLDLLRRF